MNTSRCQGCKVVSYCSREHQSIDWPAHKTYCSTIKKARTRLEAQEIALRAHPGDVDTPPDAFTEGGEGWGKFWGFQGTRPYMSARYVLVEALLMVNTTAAVEAALDHSLDMVRLNRMDNQGMRQLIPTLLLRLGRDQQCYNVLKWHTTTLKEGATWSGIATPELDLRDEDAFYPVGDFIAAMMPLPHLVILTLLKLRIMVDLKGFHLRCSTPGPHAPQHIISGIMVKDAEYLDEGPAAALDMIMEFQMKLIKELYMAVHLQNVHFWAALLDPRGHLRAKPNGYMMGSREEMQVTLQQTYNAWVKSPGAIKIVEELGRHEEVLERLARYMAR